MFNNCPMKLSTIHSHLGNDYNAYKYLEPLRVIDCKAVKHATQMIHRGIILTDDECNQILDFMIEESEGWDNGQIIKKKQCETGSTYYINDYENQGDTGGT